jgi:chitinase
VIKDLADILYSFADTDASSGAIKLTDSYADESVRRLLRCNSVFILFYFHFTSQKHYPGDSWSDSGNNLYGCLKQLYLLKLKKRNLKVLLSIGGWTYSQSGKLKFGFTNCSGEIRNSIGHFNFVTNPSARATFVTNAVQLVEDYGFDGMYATSVRFLKTSLKLDISDIDYEYPANSEQGQGFADLLTELRKGFTALKDKKGDSTPYLISAAVAAGPQNYAYYKVPQMNEALDYWNLMVPFPLDLSSVPFIDFECDASHTTTQVHGSLGQTAQPTFLVDKKPDFKQTLPSTGSLLTVRRRAR